MTNTYKTGQWNGGTDESDAFYYDCSFYRGTLFTGIARFKRRPMVFVMEGSLFWVGYNFRKTVAETVKLLAPDYPVAFKAIKDCGIVGAAKLVA